MWIVVFLTGLMISAASVILMFRLDDSRLLLETFLSSRWLYLAALLRLLLGAALIAAAPGVKYSLFIELLGWLMAFGAIVLVSVPEDFRLALIEKILALPVLILRLWLLLGVALGVAIGYAALT